MIVSCVTGDWRRDLSRSSRAAVNARNVT